jgi:formylglycine-generating enzyme required for sulfatase activity
MRGSAAIDRLDTAFDYMLRIPGGTFRMGSDKHYPRKRQFIASRLTASGSIACR